MSCRADFIFRKISNFFLVFDQNNIEAKKHFANYAQLELTEIQDLQFFHVPMNWYESLNVPLKMMLESLNVPLTFSVFE